MRTLRACILCITALPALLSATSAAAFDLDPSDIRGKSSKEPVAVLQNRYFLKAYRPEIGFTTGMLLDEAYLKTMTLGLRAGLFINEWVGFEVQNIRTRVSDSDDRKALNGMKYRPLKDQTPEANSDPSRVTETIVTPDPEVNAIHAITDFAAIGAPFYGKLNILNIWIIYTDLYLTGGVSRLETDQGAKTGLNLGAGERFYIGKAWSVRVDFKDRIFTETRSGAPSRKHSKGVDFGASYFFN